MLKTLQYISIQTLTDEKAVSEIENMEVALIIGGMFGLLASVQLWSDRQKMRLVEDIPQTIMRTKVELPPRTEKGEIYPGDILDELSRTTLHILFGVMSGAGKSTSMKMIIWKIHQNNPTAKFVIVDPKTTDWLGLQLFPDTVYYLSGDVVRQLVQLRQITQKVYQILDGRISEGQELLKLGRSLPEPEHDIYLIIDEWFALCDAIKKTPMKDRADYGLNEILLFINALIAKGREHKIHVFLVAQSHLAGETGISTTMRRSIALVGQGRLTSSGDGGFASVQGIIKDANVFKDSAQREILMESLRAAIAQSDGQPVIMTTMGNPRVGLVEDLSYVHGLRIEDY